MSTSERHKQKMLLMKQIQQQRLEFIAYTSLLQKKSEPYLYYWKKLSSLRHYFVIGASIVMLYSVRHPNKGMQWSQHALGIWSAVRVLKKSLVKK